MTQAPEVVPCATDSPHPFPSPHSFPSPRSVAGPGGAGAGAGGGPGAGGGLRLHAVPAGSLAVLALVAVTAAWGSTFFMIKGAVTRVPAADFLALRFWIAAVVLWALWPRSIVRLGRSGRRHGAWLGLIYGLGQLLQTWGLEHTSASVSGFVTGMYVVITPLLAALLLRRRVDPVVWPGVLLATAGLAVLSLHGVSIGFGEAVTLLSAAFYAGHIVGLGAWSRGRETYGLAVVQMFAVAVTCSVAAIPDGLALPVRTGDWLTLVYLALVSGAGALLLQTWAQAHLDPARAAVIMTGEPVWAGLFAVTFGAESAGGRLLVGGALTLAAALLAELGPRGVRRPEPPGSARDGQLGVDRPVVRTGQRLDVGGPDADPAVHEDVVDRHRRDQPGDPAEQPRRPGGAQPCTGGLGGVGVPRVDEPA